MKLILQNAKMLTSAALLALCSIGSVAATKAAGCPVADVSIVAHTGTSVGKVEPHNGCTS